MNSMLQCLSNTVEFRENVLKQEFMDTLNSIKNDANTNDKILNEYANAGYQLQLLFSSMWCNDDMNNKINNNSIAPSELRSAIGKFAPRFASGTQEDAFEFLIYLLSSLHSVLNVNKNKKPRNVDISDYDDEMGSKITWKTHSKSNKSMIVDLFHALQKQTLVCGSCDEIIKTFDIYLGLSLSIPKQASNGSIISIYDCLDKFTSPKHLNQKTGWLCQECDSGVQGIKTVNLWTAPKVLIIKFDRFKTVGKYTKKNEEFIQYPMQNMEIKNCKQEIIFYDLFAVCVHLGSTPDEGHYIAYALNSNNYQWYCFNDTNIKRISEKEMNQIVTRNAYVLFYSRE